MVSLLEESLWLDLVIRVSPWNIAIRTSATMPKTMSFSNQWRRWPYHQSCKSCFPPIAMKIISSCNWFFECTLKSKSDSLVFDWFLPATYYWFTAIKWFKLWLNLFKIIVRNQTEFSSVNKVVSDSCLLQWKCDILCCVYTYISAWF